jgi:hypothetical protein
MPRRTAPSRALAAALALACAAPVQAAPGRKGKSEARRGVSAFEQAFADGQAQFDRGAYAEAARTWTRGAEELPETPANRGNRAALYEYIADAYERAVAGEDDPALAREALATLDRYAEQIAAAYPGASPPAKVEAARTSFRARVQRDEAPAPAPTPEAPPPPPPPRDEPPPSKPWKGLAIGGGVALAGGAAMLGVFAAGVVKAESQENAFDFPARGCSLAMPAGTCAEIYDAGVRANRVAVAGLVLAPALVAAGVAMLVIATRRQKAARRTALVPAFGRGAVGFTWVQRF